MRYSDRRAPSDLPLNILPDPALALEAAPRVELKRAIRRAGFPCPNDAPTSDLALFCAAIESGRINFIPVK